MAIDPTTGIATAALGLASRFPDAAQTAWKTAQSAQRNYNSLSPKARQHIQVVAAKSKDVVLTVYSVFFEAYPTLLRWGSRPVEQWRQPPDVILWLLARIILLFLPVDDVWSDIELPKHKLVYVGNQCLFGIDTLTTLAAIYTKTGAVPRTFLSHFHFKIPFWKQLIEYFGAVDSDDTDILDRLMCSGYPILAYPGGSRESFRACNDGQYTLLWDSRLIGDLNNAAIKYGYPVVPVASIGVNHMLKPVYDLRYDPWDTLRLIPIVVPVSYERQYLTFYQPLYMDALEDDDEFVKDTLEVAIMDTLARRQSAGDDRILLRRIRTAIAGSFIQVKPLLSALQKTGGVFTQIARGLISAFDRICTSNEVNHKD